MQENEIYEWEGIESECERWDIIGQACKLYIGSGWSTFLFLSHIILHSLPWADIWNTHTRKQTGLSTLRLVDSRWHNGLEMEVKPQGAQISWRLKQMLVETLWVCAVESNDSRNEDESVWPGVSIQHINR